MASCVRARARRVRIGVQKFWGTGTRRGAAVWSLIDRPAIEAQLRASDKMASTGVPSKEFLDQSALGAASAR